MDRDEQEAALEKRLTAAALEWWRIRNFASPRYADFSETEAELMRATGSLARFRGDDKPRYPQPGGPTE